MLKVSNLTKDYEVNSENIRILDNLSFSVDDGEILGITGKSGCGKTTLLKILRGVEPFEGGNIEIDGMVVEADSGKEGMRALAKKSAIHLQRNFGLWTGPAIDNIIRRLNYIRVGDESLPTVHSQYYEEIHEQAMDYLKLVGLEHKALHSSNLLSGGEKQRLIIARQIAASPKLLLLDEPVTMTGPGTKQEILDVIKELKDKISIPIVVVSHLPEVHLYLADRLLYMEEGKIIEDGKPEAVLRNFLKDIKASTKLKELPSKNPCIKVDKVSKRLALIRLGEVLNIKDLSLDINKGEIVSLIGPSGAGKTTLMKIMEGLTVPNGGSVTYLHNGEWIDITHFTRQRMELRRKVSIMHQEFSLSPHSTVRSQIAFKLRMKKEGATDHARKVAKEMGISDEVLDAVYALPDMSDEDASKMFTDLKLPPDIYSRLFSRITREDVDEYSIPVFDALDLPIDILDKTPYQISGGEHVRAYIAMALATSPEILMLDEPFGDLDPVTLRDVTNSLKRINERFGTTIVLVSHHMDFVKEVAHRAILIDNGEIIMDGEPDPVCQKLIDSSNASYLEHTIKELEEAN